MKFEYSARTKEGKLQAGYVEAASKDLALEILKRNELFVLSLVPAKSKLIEQIGLFKPRVKSKDLFILTRQLATLIKAKLNLAESLKSLADQTDKPAVREVLLDLIANIEGGLSFSQSLERHPEAFSSFYVSIVRSAEITGRFEESLEFLADYLERTDQIRSKIKGAMIYPAFILVLFVIVIVVLLTVVFPQLKPLFEESNVRLPFITRFLLNLGEFMQTYGIALVILLAVGVYFLVRYFKSKEGRSLLDNILLNFPGLGDFLRKVYVAQMAEAMHILIKGGVPLVQALEISSITMGSPTYQLLLHETADAVRKGEILSAFVAKQKKYFPTLVAAMITVGEKTGSLGDMLKRVADYFIREVDTAAAALSELIQPIIMVVLAVFVGLLFASVLLPIFNLVQSF